MIEAAKRLDTIGEYYFSHKLREIEEMNRTGKQVINLGIGSPDMDPNSSVLDCLKEEVMVPGIHGYQGYKGIPELRKAIVRWSMECYGIQLNPENEVLPLMGSKEGIMHISLAFVNEGDGVLVPDPGYPTYTSVSELVGARIHRYDVDPVHGICLKQIEELARSKNIKLMWTNFPHMPTGVKADLIVLEGLIALARKHKFLLVNDNPYSVILTDDFVSAFQIDSAKDVCLELNSLSKSHNMAGWRIGWLSGASELINTVLKVKSNMDSGMFLPLQKAAIKALETGLLELPAINEEYRKRRVLAWEIMDLIGCSFSRESVGMFVWGKIERTDKTSEELTNHLLKESRVFVTPGFIFGSNGNGYIRISLCSSQHLLKEAKQQIINNNTKNN